MKGTLTALQAAGKFKKSLRKPGDAEESEPADSEPPSTPGNFSGTLGALRAVGKFKKLASSTSVDRSESAGDVAADDVQSPTSPGQGWRQAVEAQSNPLSPSSSSKKEMGPKEDDADDLTDDGEDGSQSTRRRRGLGHSSSAPAMAYEKWTVSVSRMSSWMTSQKAELEEHWRTEQQLDKATYALTAADNLRGLLLHQHGTCTRGWRTAIDKKGMHRIGRIDFYMAMRELGFSGDSKAAWTELSCERGTITLADLDTDAARMLSDFYRAFLANVGRISDLVAGAETLRVDKEAFLKRCKVLAKVESGEGLLDLKAVFKALQTIIGFVTQADCDWLEHYCERGKRKPRQSNEADEEERAARAARKAAKQAVTDFRLLLQHRYGSVVGAWHKVLDKGGRGAINFQDLSGFCDQFGYKRDVADLWQGLTGGEKFSVRLEDLEPAAVRSLENFKTACEKRFGSVTTAFVELKAEKKPLVSKEEFTRWCKEILHVSGTHKTLYNYLDETDVGYIVLDAVDAHAARNAFSKEKLDKANTTLVGLESNAGKQGHPTLLQREINRGQVNKRPADAPGTHLKAFIDYIEEQFGSKIRAWQAVFDVKRKGKLPKGKLTKKEFAATCVMLGYRGSVDLIWEDMGKSNESTLKYKDLDPDAGDEIRDFKEIAIDRYVTVHDALSKVTTSKNKNNPRASREQFKTLCWRLKIDQSKRDNLFNLLDAPGRNVVSAKSLEWLSDMKDGVGEEKALANILTTLAAKRDERWTQKLTNMRPPPRLECVEAQKEKIKATRANRKAKKDIENSREELLRSLSSPQFGGITRGWQLGLDKDREGELGLEEFTDGMKRVGLLKNNADDAAHDRVDRLFELLEDPEEKVVTLSNLDRGATSKALVDFRFGCIQRFGSLQIAFQEYDPKGTGQVTTKQFRAMCHEVKCADRAFRLLQLLDPSDTGHIRFEEIDKDVATSAQDFCQGRANLRKNNRKIAEKKRGAHMFKEPPPINVPSGPAVRAKEREKQPSLNIIRDLRLQLCHRHGSVPRAWRKKLSPEGEAKIGYDVFLEACKACKLTGDFEAAWKLLSKKGAPVTLEELEPAVVEDMRELRKRLTESFGSIEEALESADADGSFTFKFKGFKTLCDYIQFRRNERRLFDYLDKKGEDKVDFGSVFPTEVERVQKKRVEEETRKQLWQEAQERRLEASRRRVAGLPPLEDLFVPKEDLGEDGEESSDEESDL